MVIRFGLRSRVTRCAVVILAANGPVRAQPAPIAQDRDRLISSTARAVEQLYVFPDVGKRMADDLRARLARGEYGVITSPAALAESLTAHLRSISHDLHLELRFSSTAFPNPLPIIGTSPFDSAFFRHQNYGVSRVERLDGNVARLELSGFFPPGVAAPTMAGAMRLVGSSDALIIDLRTSSGGWPEMVAYLCSYFVPPTPVHLDDIHWRTRRGLQRVFTRRQLDGPRYLDKPVFILTSRTTGSAAEAFTYSMQALRRAVIVGDTTAGAANPSLPVRLDDHNVIIMPQAYVVNSVTKTNWERVGIIPQIIVPADSALPVAHELALSRLIERGGDPLKTSWWKSALQALKPGPR